MDRPNVVLITTDQHNAEVLGCMGNSVVQTPNIDSLASEGIVFSQAFTPFPICTPARTSIFTGLLARNHGVRHNINMNYKPGPYALSPERVAFPEILAENGYQTAFFGKLHTRHEGGKNFGIQTARLVEGKGHFVGSPEEKDEYRRYLLEKGYPEDIWKVWENDPSYAQNGFVTSPLPEEDYIDTFIANIAIEHLEQVQDPFFAWVSFCTPHNPWDPPKPYGTMYDPADIPMPHRKMGELEKKHPTWVEQIAKTIPPLPATSTDRSLPGGIENAYSRFPEEKTRRMLAAYYGEISHVDRQVGRVIDTLRSRDMLENTLVIFTSDHGDYLGNNWAFYKYGALYDSLIRVPLVCSWQAGIRGGKQVDELTSLVDIMPTILDACGIPVPNGIDGFSLLPLSKGNAENWRDELLVETGSTSGVVTAQWKFFRWRDGTEELYHRIRDPHDLDNLSSDPQTEHIKSGLRERIR